MIKNPHDDKSWNGIRELTETEKQVVNRIVDLYAPEDGVKESVVIEGAIVITYETPEIAAKAAKAFEAHDFENVKVYKDKPAIRVPFVHEYSADEVEEISQETDEDILQTLKAESMTAMLSESDAIASFIEENEAQTTGYINKANSFITKGGVSEETKKKYVYAFNLGRVNARESVSNLLDFASELEGVDNADKVICLGQLVTKVQAFENTALGKLIDKALPNLLTIGESFLDILL